MANFAKPQAIREKWIIAAVIVTAGAGMLAYSVYLDSQSIGKRTDAINRVIDEAGVLWQDGESVATSLLKDINAIGLVQIREKRKADGKRAGDAFDKAIERFTSAADDCVGIGRGIPDKPENEKVRNYYLEKGRAFSRMADVNRIDRKMIDAIFEDALDQVDLVTKLKLFSAQRDSVYSGIGGDNLRLSAAQ